MTPYAGLATGVRKYLLPIVLLASLLACLFGLQQSHYLAASFWQHPKRSAASAIAIAAILYALARYGRRRGIESTWLLAILIVAVAAAFGGIGAVAAALLQFVAAFCIGRRLYRADAVESDTLLWSALATTVGLAALSFAIGLLSLLPVNNPATYLLLLALPVVLGWQENLQALRGVHAAWRAPAAEGASRWVPVLQLLVAFTLMVRLLSVLHPELGADALAMHMVIAENLQVTGRFHYDPTQSIWALMPMASDWQFAISYMLGGEHSARLANFGAEALLLVLVYRFCAARKGALAGAAAALVYVVTPLMYLETTSLFVENFWTLWVCGALLAGVRSLDAGGPREAACVGLMAGTALAAKVTTIFAAPFFLAIAAAWLWSSRAQGWRKFGAFSGVFALASFLPYTMALLRSGNPVFPFMNEVFKSPYYFSAAAFNSPFRAGFGWKTLYEVTFASGNYLESSPGAMGIAFLLLLPAAIVHSLFESVRMRVAALCAIAFVLLVFHFTSYLRYILPVMPVFAAMVGLMVADVSARSQGLRAALLSALLGSALFGLYLTPTSNYNHRQISLPPFAGSEAEQRYLQKMRPERRLAQVIEALPLRKVLWLGNDYIATTRTDVELVNWHGGYVQAREFDALPTVDAMQRWMVYKKFDAIVVVPGANNCVRQVLCDYLDTRTTRIFQDGDTALYVPSEESIYARELLANPSFDRGIMAWNGAGSYISGQGAVRVSASKSLAQRVAVKAEETYLLQVEGRCKDPQGAFRAQVNWQDASAKMIGTEITVVPCGATFRRFSKLVEAPPHAAYASVYATGHLPDVEAEIGRVSLRAK